MQCIYTKEYYSATKKNKALPFITKPMNLQGIILREISHRKTNTIKFHLCMESKKQSKWTKIMKQKQTHRYREQTGGCQSGEV